MNINRRTLISVALAIPPGLLAGWFTSGMHTNRQAALGVIGRDDAQYWLFDTGKQRALIMLGAYSPELIESLSTLATMERGNVDLIIASHGLLAAVGAEWVRSQSTARVIAVSTSHSAAPLSFPHELISDLTMVEFGEDVALALEIPVQVGEDQPIEWSVTIAYKRLTFVLATSQHAIPIEGSPANLVGEPALEQPHPGAMIHVSNASDSPALTENHYRAHASSPRWFRLQDDEIRLPQDAPTDYDS